MDYSKVRVYVETQLKNLSDKLKYHSAWHTFNDVLPAVERYAKKYDLSNEENILLKTAAIFHDAGYLKKYNDNEPIAASLAVTELPKYNYSSAQVMVVKQLILVTAMPQDPKTLLEEIICDSDLDSLGRDDFFELSMNLLTELRNFGYKITKQEWLCKQHEFLNKHTYFTDSAKILRNKGKMKNINLIMSLVNESRS